MLLYSCRNVSKSFGSRNLFRDLALNVDSQDRIGLIGPNGAGKSTFLKIIAGVEEADSGEFAPRKGLKIGYVPQSPQFEAKGVKEILEGRKGEEWLSRLGFKGDERAELLSGGWKKRLSFAQVLMQEPDLILFDEPTNHLDLEGIVWLENFLSRWGIPYILVSHDRYFLQNTTNRVIEISPSYPGGLFEVQGDYAEFLERKETFLQGQVEQEKSLASKARHELAWLRRGAKARTTKSQARIDSAHELFSEKAEVTKRNQEKRADIRFAASERETRKLLTLKNVGKGDLFSKLDLVLSPGTRIGLTGPNGSGKTTLLRLMAGETAPDQGTIKPADDLKIVYFDQHRIQLPDHLLLKDALSPKGDYVHYHGREIHVNGWCKRFLFSPDLLNMPLSTLSGGEKARISIAHLMLQEADVLLLDEPTNDLDIPTLETLEESLLDFPGAIVLITHDRCMLDRVCKDTLALGKPKETEVKEEVAPPPTKKKSLSYHEKKEYEAIEGKIATLEAKVQELHILLESSSANFTELCTELALHETEIERLYLRFSELDAKKS